MSKQPYELSIWKDINKSSYIDENFIAIIGSDTMDSPLKAYNVTLKENKNGELILTFSMQYKYLNSDNELVSNPLFDLLSNETKLKLRDGEAYSIENENNLTPSEVITALNEIDNDERWKDFIIKSIDKDSTTNTALITAKESYVNELSKNGWSIELTSDLENNWGTLPYLSEKVLDGSDWTVEGYSPIQTTEEPLFKTTTTAAITVTKMVNKVNGEYVESTDNLSIPSGETIYIFYSCAEYDSTDSGSWKLKGNEIQLLYSGDIFTINSADDNRTIIDDDYIYNYTISKTNIENNINSLILTGTSLNDTAFNGNKIKKTQKQTYDQKLNKYVSIYTCENSELGIAVGSEVKEYEETEYLTSGIVINYLANSTGFTSTNGWKNQNSSDPSLKLFPAPSGTTYTDGFNYLVLASGNSYTNNGMYISKVHLTNKNQYVVRFKGRWIRTSAESYNYIDSNYPIYPDTLTGNFSELQFKLINATDTESYSNEVSTTFSGNQVYLSSNTSDNSKKGYLIATSSESDRIIEGNESYIDEKGYGYVFLQANQNTDENDAVYLKITVPTLANFDFCLEDIQIFDRTIYYDANDNEHIVFPNDAPVSATKINKTYYYRDSSDEVVYLPSIDEYYAPKYSEDYKSVRRIEVKESNYFNNIQNLAELFEVWVRFYVQHCKNGKIKLDSNNNQIKKVIYSRYSSGGDSYNSAGFKYGINLKGIKRVVDSSSIVTKLIVKDNNQEYALNNSGSCTIKYAKSNPSGEYSILNFNYYINQGLLDYNQVLKDLYGTTNDDLRYLPRLKIYNESIRANSEFLSAYEFAKLQIQSEYDLYEASRQSAQDKANELLLEMNQLSVNDSLYKSDQKAYAQTLTKIESYTDYLAELIIKKNNYSTQIELIKTSMETMQSEKKTLQVEFYRKYSRFIQEGTWTDESYIDDELYYLDALQVASTSAYPKISYTINVIEINTIEGFEPYKFKIGDRTYVEDPEFFGYNTIVVPNIGNAVTPIKMEVIISERSRNLDDSSKTTITVKNYKNQFEELFQKITATTTSLQYQSGSYDRAAGVVTSTGEINTETLTKSFENNSLVLSSSTNQSVLWDTGTGIEVINNENANERVRIVGGGIFISTDGGNTWNNAIRGSGINTKYLIAGQIDTSKVNIISGNTPYFRWDTNGISAYAVDTSTQIYDMTKFVRFSQYGIYATDNGVALDTAIETATTFDGKIQAIKDNSTFSITWDGINLSISDLSFQDNSLELTALNGLEIFNGTLFPNDTISNYSYIIDPTGTLYDTTKKIPIISLGMFKNTVNGTGIYGLRMRNNEGKIVLSTDATGQFWINENLFVGGDFNYSTYDGSTYGTGLSGQIITEENYLNYIRDIRFSLNLPTDHIEGQKQEFLRQNSIRIWAGGSPSELEKASFFVLENGILKATNAYIQGTILASKGKFSGLLTIGDDQTIGIDGDANNNQLIYGGKTEIYDENNEVIGINYNFRLDKDGIIYANQANISGSITATSGNIINLLIGNNSGIGLDLTNENDNIILWSNASNISDKSTSSFYVTKNGELYTSKVFLKDSILIGAVDINSDSIIDYYKAGINNESNSLAIWAGAISNLYTESNFTVDYEGNVIAKSLNLAGGELLGGNANLTGTLFLRSNNSSEGLILSSDSGISTTTFNMGGNIGWSILSNGDAYFNNIIARGELKAATFTYESKNMMGGDLLISPAYFSESSGILSINSMGYEVKLLINFETYNKDIWNDIDGNHPQILFNCILSNGEEYSGLNGDVTKIIDSNNYYLIVNIPKDKNTDITFTSWNNISSVLPGSSLALQNGCGISLTAGDMNGPAVIITDIVDTSKVITQLGRLGADSEGIGIHDQYFGDLSGYGLYAQNAYITGKLFLPNAGITDEATEYNGLNKIGSGSGQYIRIWAGSPPDNKNIAPFVVTQDGTLYASQGIFTGKVIATDSTFSGWLNTAGILIDPDDDSDDIKQIFYVAYDSNNRTIDGFPLIEDRILQIDKNGISIWEGGLSVFSDWSAGWRDNTKGNILEPYYGPILEGNIENYSNIYPYISSIDNEYHRLYTSDFHSNHFINGESKSIKIVQGIIQFSTYNNDGSLDFKELENEAFNNSNNYWNIKLDEDKHLKIYPLVENNEGYIKFKDSISEDNEIEIEIQGLLEVNEEITLIKRASNSKPKINFPEAIIQHYNNVDNIEWDNGIDFMI